MFAVILLPQFRLQAALRFREELHEQAVAITDETDSKARVLEISEAAAKAGVVPGLSSSQALARCSALTLLSRSPAQETAAQSSLLEIAGTLSPEVEATADGYVTADLRSVRSPDWSALATRTVGMLAALHLSARVGIGSNPDLAFLAARHARPALVVQSPTAFLANLAIHELDPSPELLSVLSDWGVHNLAQLTSLPRGALMDRLGPSAACLWERAAGQTGRPLRLVRPAEEFSEAFDFEHEIDTAEPLLFLLRRFLDQLAIRLGSACRVAGQMAFTLLLADESRYERGFTVPSPTADVDVLFRILHTHLDGLRLAHGAVGVRLCITPTLAERQQFQLFESPLRDPNRFGETLGRLAALVGEKNVGVPFVIDSHKPDSFRLDPPRFHEPGHHAPTADDFAVGLPLRRYRPPVAADVHVIRHAPVFLASAQVCSAVRDARGPYRVSGAWWESDSWAMEEWDVELETGGLYRIARAGDAWRMEGSYNEPATAGVRATRAIVPMRPQAG